MRETFGPPLRAAALSAFIVGLILMVMNPPSLAGLGGVLALAAGAVAIILVTAWLTVALIGEEMPEPEFRRLVDRSEALAALPPPDDPPSEFDELESVTARRGMRELLLRATVYRARLGEAGALDAARSLAGQIDNPALDNLFASSELRAAAG